MSVKMKRGFHARWVQEYSVGDHLNCPGIGEECVSQVSEEGCVQDGVLLGGSGTLAFLYRLLQPQEFCGTVQPDPLAQVTSLLPEKQQVWVQEVPARFEGETGLPKTCFLEGFSGSQAGKEDVGGRPRPRGVTHFTDFSEALLTKQGEQKTGSSSRWSPGSWETSSSQAA